MKKKSYQLTFAELLIVHPFNLLLLKRPVEVRGYKTLVDVIIVQINVVFGLGRLPFNVGGVALGTAKTLFQQLL